MPLQLFALVVDAVDPPALARFWASLLGWELVDDGPLRSGPRRVTSCSPTPRATSSA